MKGTVIEKIGRPVGNQFNVEGEDGKVYFAHLGDLLDNPLENLK